MKEITFQDAVAEVLKKKGVVNAHAIAEEFERDRTAHPNVITSDVIRAANDMLVEAEEADPSYYE